MAPPKISAKEVATEAITADAKMGTLTQRGRYLVAASDRHSPEAMPKWAALCWSKISIIVDKVTIHSST